MFFRVGVDAHRQPSRGERPLERFKTKCKLCGAHRLAESRRRVCLRQLPAGTRASSLCKSKFAYVIDLSGGEFYSLGEPQAVVRTIIVGNRLCAGFTQATRVGLTFEENAAAYHKKNLEAVDVQLKPSL